MIIAQILADKTGMSRLNGVSGWFGSAFLPAFLLATLLFFFPFGGAGPDHNSQR